MAKLSAGRAVVEVLKAEGVKFVFGMPGGHTIGIYDALYGQQEITHVLVRHEQHAASMAAGYAQLTGEPGICCVTAGPGATNLVTSIAEAFVGALPIVIIAGRGATRNAHRGASQEIDQVRIFGPITKWAIRVDRPDLIVESLRQAFNVARSGKPGPVLVDIPQDVLAVGGLGHHRQEITKRLLPNADVVLGIGTRFEQQETNWKPDYLPAPGATYIQIDMDPVEISRSVVATIGIVGDAKLVLQDLLAELDQSCVAGRWNDVDAQAGVDEMARQRAALESEISDMVASDSRPLHPIRVIRKIREAFPRHATVAIDVGVLAQGMGGAFPYFKIYQPRSTIVPSSFYGMGFSASAFPVARLVYPDRPAVCLVGDGSFQMVMNILPVAAELKLGVTWCILNDGALGSIREGPGLQRA